MTSVVSVRKALTDRFPPLDDPIHETITGHCGGDAIDKQRIRRREQDADGRHRRLRLEIVVRRLTLDPTLPPRAKGPTLTMALASIEIRKTSSACISAVIHVGYLGEDRVGFGMFLRLTLATFLGVVPQGIEFGRQGRAPWGARHQRNRAGR